jgi:hypothetical protein
VFCKIFEQIQNTFLKVSSIDFCEVDLGVLHKAGVLLIDPISKTNIGKIKRLSSRVVAGLTDDLFELYQPTIWALDPAPTALADKVWLIGWRPRFTRVR